MPIKPLKSEGSGIKLDLKVAMDSQGSSPAPVAPVSATVAPKPLHRKIEHVHKLEK